MRDPNPPRKRQISVTDITSGMRVVINARRPRGRGWEYHSDHRVVSIHYFDSGALMCFVLEPWIGGERVTVQARHVLDVHLIEIPQSVMKVRAND